MPVIFRYLLFAFGILLGLPLLAVLYSIWGIPLTLSGYIYLVGCALIVLGLVLMIWQPRYALLVSLTGCTILLITMASRILYPPRGTQMNLVTLPGSSGPRAINRILNEQDMVLVGAKIAPSVGFVSSLEKRNLDPALIQTYQEMHAQRVTPLSPVLATYLGQQHSDRFDALVSDPSPEPTGTGIIFLHGFGGNFTLQCWLIAKAADRIGAITLCSSTDPGGRWWTEQGANILQESINYLHQRGTDRIYLAGLSNGGIGASRLAGRFEADLAGLILISGADPSAQRTGLPVLLVHGEDDERIPASIAENYVAASGPNITYRSIEGDHFVLLKEADQVQAAIADWLMEQEGK